MFTGIVYEVGTVKDVVNAGGLIKVVIASNKVYKKTKVGSSVLINGICSTVKAKKRNMLAVEYTQETLRVTTAKGWQAGQKVNLEPALLLGDEISGHLVYGHIDGLGQVKQIRRYKQNCFMAISFHQDLMKYLVYKGSVCVDGVSLTIAKINSLSFQISLIPLTLKMTTLSSLKERDFVNIEVDLIAKYVVNYLEYVKGKTR